ncbi:macro domain-containing protein [Leuconostoc mesenteroides subsp. dextranicum]|uniref:macro domain-containing protein n=1 Tax=Leuconostoc mesenteroides TaxID=1245 RepID=UPI003C90C7FE
MNKVSFFDNRLLKKFWQIFSVIGGIVSFFLLFWDIPKKYKINFLAVTLVILLVYYVIAWIFAKRQKRVTLKFGESNVDVYFGDIFQSKKDDLKVISFNEYFDTKMDEQTQIISPGTINGKFIEKNKENIFELDEIFEKDVHLNEKMFINIDNERKIGKKKRYHLGALVKLPDNYLAVAGSKFDKDNKANISMREYIGFLLTFWSEVDRIYNNQSVVIPVFGSGVLRFTDGYAGATSQELLEIIIWTFKISRIKIAYPSRIKIVVFENQSDMYNLYKLKEIERDGL